MSPSCFPERRNNFTVDIYSALVSSFCVDVSSASDVSDVIVVILRRFYDPEKHTVRYYDVSDSVL